MPVFIHYCKDMDWSEEAKRLLKSELARRGISHADLAELLNDAGINETKKGIDSKMSRGSFSACFLLQCLNVIGCKTINIEILEPNMVEEPIGKYIRRKIKKSSDD